MGATWFTGENTFEEEGCELKGGAERDVPIEGVVEGKSNAECRGGGGGTADD